MRILIVIGLLLALTASAHAQLYQVVGTGTGDYQTTSQVPVQLLQQKVSVPVGKTARVDVSGSVNWYVISGDWCDAYVDITVDGVVYSYVGFTNSPKGGSNDKPFTLFAYKEGDGASHQFGFSFWTGTPGCKIGVENTGTTNLVMTAKLES